MHKLLTTLAILIVATLSACTGHLTNEAEFSDLVGRELLLVDTGKPRNWNFWRVPALAITRHSQSYRLNLFDRAGAQQQSMFLDPDRVEDLGSAVGATIIIESVREYGMETAYPIVLGQITLPDRVAYPFEAEWRPDYSLYVRPAQ